MRLQLPKLQDDDEKVKILRASGLPEDWEDVERVFQYRELTYVPKIICSKVISYHHNHPLVGHFGIDKTGELVGQKYYWPNLRKDIKNYDRGCDICLTSKTICHKPYENLQSLSVSTHRWKDLLMNFVTGLPLSANWKGNSYNSILVIVDHVTKIVHYEPVKITIDAPKPAEIIIDMVVQYHGLLGSIINN